MSKKSKYILVAGIGNEILTDDGIGPKLSLYLKNKFKNSDIHFETLCVGGLEVLEFIQGYKMVIFIDAIKTKGGKPGDVYLFTPSDFRETLHLSNLHDTNFITALEMGKSLGFKIPKQIYIIAIEIKEDKVFGEEFTEELAFRYNDVKEKARQYILSLVPQHIFS